MGRCQHLPRHCRRCTKSHTSRFVSQCAEPGSAQVDRNSPNSAPVVSLAQHHWQKPVGSELSQSGKEQEAYDPKQTRQTQCFGLALKDAYVIIYVWQLIALRHETTSPLHNKAQQSYLHLGHCTTCEPLLTPHSASPPAGQTQTAGLPFCRADVIKTLIEQHLSKLRKNNIFPILQLKKMKSPIRELTCLNS